MIIAWQNLADAATLTTDSAQASLPATNVQHPHLARQWHAAAGVKTAYLIADLGASLTCALLALLGTNLTPSATIRIRSSDSDATVTSSLEVDTGTVSAGAVAGYGAVYKSFTATASRYWRADLSDSAVADHLQVGRLFLGPSWTPTYGHSWGWSVASVDPSRKARSYGGQAYAGVRPQRRVLTFSLDWNNEAQMFSNAFALARAQGITGDILAVPDMAGSYLSQQAVWGSLAASEPLINERVGIWRQKFTIEEAL